MGRLDPRAATRTTSRSTSRAACRRSCSGTGSRCATTTRGCSPARSAGSARARSTSSRPATTRSSSARCEPRAGRGRDVARLHRPPVRRAVIDAVIFDMDGVLIDSEQVWDDVREKLARERGGRWHPGAQRDMMGMSSPEWSRYMHDRIVGCAESAGGDQPRSSSSGWSSATPTGRRGSGRARRRAALAERYTLGLASSSNRELIDVAARGRRDRGALRRDRLVRGGRAREAGARRLPRGRAPARRRAGRVRRDRGLAQRHPLGEGRRHAAASRSRTRTSRPATPSTRPTLVLGERLRRADGRER